MTPSAHNELMTRSRHEEGTRKYIRLRRAELDHRFPGLLDSVLRAAAAAA